MEAIKQSTRSKILDLAPNCTVAEIVIKLQAQRKYVTTVLKNAGLKAKPEIVNLGGRPMKDKGVTSKIKLSQSDMQKGNVKLQPKEKVFKQAVRDESKVRVVQLDSRTVKLIYPNQKGYDIPLEVLRSDWQTKQAQGLANLKGV